MLFGTPANNTATSNVARRCMPQLPHQQPGYRMGTIGCWRVPARPGCMRGDGHATGHCARIQLCKVPIHVYQPCPAGAASMSTWQVTGAATGGWSGLWACELPAESSSVEPDELNARQAGAVSRRSTLAEPLQGVRLAAPVHAKLPGRQQGANHAGLPGRAGADRAGLSCGSGMTEQAAMPGCQVNQEPNMPGCQARQECTTRQIVSTAARRTAPACQTEQAQPPS
jgi:hypothetical protein